MVGFVAHMMGLKILGEMKENRSPVGDEGHVTVLQSLGKEENEMVFGYVAYMVDFQLLG